MITNLIEESMALERAGKMADAIAKATQAREAAEAQEDSLLVGAALIAESRALFRMGQYEIARTLAEKALGFAAPKTMVCVDAFLLLGMCSAETNSLAGAERFFRQAGDMARELGYPLARFRALHNLASGVYLPRGQFELALTADQEAYQVAQLHDLREWLYFPLITIAWACQLTGQRQREMVVLEELARILPPDWAAYGYYEVFSADLALDEHDLEKALELYTRAYSSSEASGEPAITILVRLGLSRYHLLSGNASASRAWADEALTCATRLGYQHLAGKARVERGRATWVCGDLAAAEEDLRAAIEALSALDAAYDLARARLVLASLFYSKPASTHPKDRGLSEESGDEMHNEPLLAARAISEGGFGFLLEQERGLVLPFIAAGLDSPEPSRAKISKELYNKLLRVDPAPLRVEMLGRFSIWIGARAIPKEALRQRRAGELLALLLCNPSHTQTFSQVTEAMCPEKDPEAGLDFYHHAISSLRRLLEPDLPDRRFACRYLKVDDERVQLLLPAGTTTDRENFEAAFRAKDWEKAVALYTGEFLPVFNASDWTIPLRQHLAEQFEFALLALAEAKFQAGDALTCLELCRRELLHNAWQEQAVELGMRAALVLGDRMAAIKLYQRLEKVLEKELGLAPQKELQLLYASARRRSLQ